MIHTSDVLAVLAQKIPDPRDIGIADETTIHLYQIMETHALTAFILGVIAARNDSLNLTRKELVLLTAAFDCARHLITQQHDMTEHETITWDGLAARLRIATEKATQ